MCGSMLNSCTSGGLVSLGSVDEASKLDEKKIEVPKMTWSSQKDDVLGFL